MKFDWTINFGHILTVISVLVIFVSAYTKIVSRIDRIEGNLDIVFRWFQTNIIDGGHHNAAEDYRQRRRRPARDEEDQEDGRHVDG